ncbi:Kinesin light chain [Hondaea fermentalgiana]|uniref:Kinesin light chain n=1 Tax=Hondaea fermentalgiana TaxID=2315210 RepID=A0A2R5G1U9_9STRA|nr:Kinesin light chain [Hondaea fermentalgiana]|eukprot:GBG24986.1 Kinesin light chain [Hondaea fermentalgiana]
MARKKSLLHKLRRSLPRVNPSHRKASAAFNEIFDEDARKLVQLRSVSFRAVKRLCDGLLSGEVASDVELYVATRKLSDKVEEGATLQLTSRNKNRMKGLEPRSGVTLTFMARDARKKERDTWTTQDVANFVLPTFLSTEQPIYLATLEEQDVGDELQGTYVAQAHDCLFTDLVDALEKHFGEDAEAAFVWLDILCTDQKLLRKSKSKLPTEIANAKQKYLTSGMHRAIGKFDAAVIFIDKWDTPAPLQQAWTAWEILGAINRESSVEVIFAPGQAEDFLERLRDDAEALAKIVTKPSDLRSATSAYTDDKATIDDAVESYLPDGYVTLNASINKCMRESLARIAEDAVKEIRLSGKEEALAEVLICAGYFLNQQDMSDKALLYYKEALVIRRAACANGEATYELATVLNGLAGVHFSLGNNKEALEASQEALDIVVKVHGEKAHDTATVLNNVALMHCAMGDHEKALEDFKTALSIDEALGNQRADEATTLFNIAATYEAQGNYEDALQTFKEALRLRQSVFGHNDPLVGQTHNNIGFVYTCLKNYAAAEKSYSDALSILKKAHGDCHPDVATTLINIGALHLEQKNTDKALEAFTQAKLIFLELLGPGNAHTKEAIDWVRDCEEANAST